MINTPDSPAQTLDDRIILGGNFWTLFTQGIWELLPAVLHFRILSDNYCIQRRTHHIKSSVISGLINVAARSQRG